MSLLNTVKQSQETIEAPEDNVGFSRTLLMSGMYDLNISAIYLTQSKSGAIAANIVGKVTTEDKPEPVEYKETIYMTNSKQEYWYTDKKSGKKHYLPGYNIMNAISAFLTNKTILDPSHPIEKRVFEIWDFESRSMQNTPVETYGDMLDATIRVGILQKKENKQAKGNNGKYEDINEAIEFNNIDLVVDANNFTFAERFAKVETAEAMDKWIERNEGKVRDSFKLNANAPAQGAPATGTSGTQSLF